MYPPLRVKVHQKYTKTTLKNHLTCVIILSEESEERQLSLLCLDALDRLIEVFL